MIPELLTPITYDEAGRYIVDPDFILQEKRDGKRLLIVKDTIGLAAYNKHGEPCAMPPALAGRINQFFRGQTITVDGEWEQSNGTYQVWDLLRCAHMDMRGLTYEQRLEPLLTLNRVDGFCVVPHFETTERKAQALLRFVELRAEGVVFKNRYARYRPGRARQHFKLKFVKTCTVKIASTDETSARIHMLDRGQWIEVAGVSLVGKDFRPTVGQYVEVKYLCGTHDKHLREPVMLRLRDDVQDSDCDFSQVVVKR